MTTQRFSIVPAHAVSDPNLTDSEYRTLSAVATYADKNGWCWPSQSKLAEIRGVSRKTINQHVKNLKELGYLNVINRAREDGGQTSNMMQVKMDYPYDPEQDPLSPLEVTPPVTSESYTPCNANDVTPPVTPRGYTNTTSNNTLNTKEKDTPLPPHYANMTAAEATHPEHITALIQAIAKVTNKHPSLQTVAEAAYTLHDWGATGDEILKLFSGRGSWWLTHKDSPGVWGKSPTPNIGSIKSFFFQAREWEASDESKAAKVASDADQLHAAWIAPLKGMNGHAREHLMKAPENVRRAVQLAVSQREIGRAEHMTVELLRANLQMVAQV